MVRDHPDRRYGFNPRPDHLLVDEQCAAVESRLGFFSILTPERPLAELVAILHKCKHHWRGPFTENARTVGIIRCG